jgi:DNA-binding HxlR family transcriptional regulator
MDAAHLSLTGTLGDRDSWRADRCSMDRAFGVLGTRSAVLILREAFYGATRFEEFVRRVRITEAVAAARLRELVEAGLLERTPYREPGSRTRHEYLLTGPGQEVLPVLLALMQWGDRHLTGADGPPLLLTHTGCGARVSVEVRCASGHEVALGEITVARWPAGREQGPDRQ